MCVPVCVCLCVCVCTHDRECVLVSVIFLPQTAPEVTLEFNSTYLQVEWNEAANTLFYLVGLYSSASSITANTTDLSASFNLQPGALYRVTVQATDTFNRPGDSFEQLFTAPALRTSGFHVQYTDFLVSLPSVATTLHATLLALVIYNPAMWLPQIILKVYVYVEAKKPVLI